jgi:3-hydroxyisobutyrate dehydrogenase
MTAQADDKRVAVLGLGIIGSAIGRNLCARGFTVSGWNRTPNVGSPLLAAGGTLAASPAAAVAGAGFVITILSDGAAVEETMMSGALAAMAPGAVWVQMSTVGVEPIEQLARLAGAAGVPFVDAPFLGTRQPAEQAKLIILGAGDRELEARCQPLFSAISARVLWLGEVGAGSRLKLVANQWSTGMVAVLAETLTLAHGLEVPPESFFDLIEGSVFGMPYARIKGSMMLAGDFPPSFPLALANKDVGLVLAAAQRAGRELPVTASIRRQYSAAEREGHGREDLAAVFTALKGERA